MVLVKATVQHPGSFNSFSENKFESYNVIKNAIYKFGNFNFDTATFMPWSQILWKAFCPEF